MIITITGTPGTGKTYFAKLLAKKIGYRYLDLNDMIKAERLYDGYDRKDKTFDVDTKKLSRFLNMLLKKYSYNKDDPNQKNNIKVFHGLMDKSIDLKKFFQKSKLRYTRKNSVNNIIIDSHLSHYIDSDICFVMRTSIDKLSKRLKKRKYPKKKIMDNVESEIFGLCLEEAKALKHKCVIINN